MIKVGIRDFTHNISKYLNEIESGENIILLKRNKPIANISPHNEGNTHPGWKREIKKIKVEGLSLTNELLKARKSERA